MSDDKTTPQYHEHIMVGGIIFNNTGEYLLIKEKDTDGKEFYTFPYGPVENLPGTTWEVLERNLSRNVFKQTGIEIEEGLIPFTDQEFLNKDGFENIMTFFIGRYKYGQPIISDPYAITEVVWKNFSDFNEKEFKPIVYQVFTKAEEFIAKLNN